MPVPKIPFSFISGKAKERRSSNARDSEAVLDLETSRTADEERNKKNKTKKNTEKEKKRREKKTGIRARRAFEGRTYIRSLYGRIIPKSPGSRYKKGVVRRVEHARRVYT